MKYILTICFFMISLSLLSQQAYFKKQVVGPDGQPLPFSTIQLQPSKKGTISNEDGFFIIPKDDLLESDSIVISHLGYKDFKILSSEFEELSSVILEIQPNELLAVEITSDKESRWAEIIFSSFQKRRESQLDEQASAIMQLRSYQDTIAVEVLEGEAMVSIDNTGMPNDIQFSFLSTNMDTANVPSFYNLSTSRLIESFGLFERLEVSSWPLHPGRLGKRSIYKDFHLDLINYDVEKKIFQFEMISKTSQLLSSRIWIHEETNDILRYEIFGDNLSVIPVISIIRGRRIENFNVHLEFEFGASNQKLNYLLWNFDFTLNSTQEISSSVKLFIRNDTLKKPIFLHKADYHDYAMAAILPRRSEKLDKEFALLRSKKDAEALDSLHVISDRSVTSLIMWDENTPFDVDYIPIDRRRRKDGSNAPLGDKDYQILSDKYNLSFNAIVYLNAQSDYEFRAFFDRSISSMPVTRELSVKLMINLLFDEYAYAAQRIVNDATSENNGRALKIERDKLDLRSNEIIMNSKGGDDLNFLLERNRFNYENYGIDRFYQLNERILNNDLFNGFNKNLDPSSPMDMAFAFFQVRDYSTSLKIIEDMSSPSAEVIFLQALIQYINEDCDKYKALLDQAKGLGHPIPDLAKTLCQ